VALVSVCLTSVLAGCQLGGDDEQQASGEIVIGADLELTGAAAATGKAYQRALELKIQQVNESGTLGGRTIRLDVRDNRSDASDSLSNISEFTNNQTVTAIVMGSCNSCALGAVKTINDRKVPTIALAASTAVATPVADRRYMFKLGPNAGDTAAALAIELGRKRLKSVAVLHTDDPYGREGVAALNGEFAKLNITTTGTQTVESTDTDVSQAVEKLIEDRPKALILWTSAEQALLAAKSARDEGFKGEFILDAAAAGPLFLEDSESRAVDNASLVFTQTMVIDDVIATTPATAARKQWFRDYTAKYGSYHAFASFAADAIQMIANAVVSADSVDRDRLRTVLETSQLDGLSGLIRITPSNHSGLMPQALTMLVARGGRWRLAGG